MFEVLAEIFDVFVALLEVLVEILEVFVAMLDVFLFIFEVLVATFVFVTVLFPLSFWIEERTVSEAVSVPAPLVNPVRAEPMDRAFV